MRFIKTLICLFFFFAVSIAPAAAIPMCKKMMGQSPMSGAATMSHCKNAMGENASGNPSLQKSVSSIEAASKNMPEEKKGCCCEGDTANSCKAGCKIYSSSAALLAEDTQQPHFTRSFTSSNDTSYTAFIFEIITPPPRACA